MHNMLLTLRNARAQPLCRRVGSCTFRLFLVHQASLVRAQGSIVHIVGDIIAQLNSTAPFARKMLGKFLAAVDEPELMLVALHSKIPGIIKKLLFVSQW